MRTVFDAETRANPIIQAHIRQNGSWPRRADAQKLLDHIGGSFIFASTLFKFIFNPPESPSDHSTPLDRFPLTLNIDPGLDGIYSQTLARSEHLPHFTAIISSLALLAKPLPISGIAELFDIQASAVAHVLVDLQAIIHVPGTDEAPVTFYHTSLRDFLTNESRSGRFFVPVSFHARLLIGCLSCELRARRQRPKDELDRRKQTAAVQYSLEYREPAHWNLGRTVFTTNELDTLIQLRRSIVELLPDGDKAAGFYDLGMELQLLFNHNQSATTIEEAISVYRKALSICPYSHPIQSGRGTQEDVLMQREAARLGLHYHPARHRALHGLGLALHSLYRLNRCVSHLEEAILMHREALSLCPHIHVYRPSSLKNLSAALCDRFNKLGSVMDLDEAISLRREALEVPHTSRPDTLSTLSEYLQIRYHRNLLIGDLDEAISLSRELVVEHYREGHKNHRSASEKLQSLLEMRFAATGRWGDREAKSR
jgi:tetratricopeptide (TPR) repeat protein